MTISMRSVFEQMDASCTGVPSLATLGKLHRLRNQHVVSLRALANRHSKSFRFVWFNTYLIPKVQADLGILGTTEITGRAPAYLRRAQEIGHGVGGDCVALCEVFTEDTRAEIIGAKTGSDGVAPSHAIGPGQGKIITPTDAISVDIISSGLLTIVPTGHAGYTMVEASNEKFNNQGDITRDADAWSNKGILRVVIDVGFETKLEVYTTHLIYGGDIQDISPAERFEVQSAQINQLVSFIQRTHPADSKNFIIVAGDFNLYAEDTAYYEFLRTQMEDLLDLEDIWVHYARARYGARLGRTNDPKACPADPANPMVADDNVGAKPSAADDKGRIDYVFIQKPNLSHDITVDIARPRRVLFPRKASWPEYDQIQHFSDHLGLMFRMWIAGKA